MTRKKLVLLTFFFFTVSISKAQWSIGGNASYMSLLSEDGSIYSFPGVALKAGNEKCEYGIGYGFKNSRTTTVLADTILGYSSHGPSEYFLESDIDYSIKFYQLFMKVKNYFSGDYDEDYGFYGIVDVSFYYMPFIKKMAVADGESRAYHHDIFEILIEEGVVKHTEEAPIISMTGGAGFGFEKKFGSVYLFTSAVAKMSVTGGGAILFPLEFNLGTRIPLKF
jgi:hypothetical protein